MFHPLRLPALTRARLVEAMYWQFTLLRWAATAQTREAADCQQWLEQRKPLRPRAKKLADWAFAADARRKALAKFANDQTATSSEKIAWIKARRTEAMRLLRRPTGTLDQIAYKDTQTPTWQKGAADFWREFYESFRNSSLPEYFFHSAGKNFTAQDFLTAFLQENDQLYVCPVCDATAYFAVTHNGAIYTDIDHYLPKSHYPHLSIHPYNLVPLCHNCNSGMKSDRDPLHPKAGMSLSLDDIWLPYHHQGLSEQLFLDIAINSDGATFNQLRFKVDRDARKQIEVLKEVYNIPEQWATKQDEIGEKLFRRMRDYLRFYSAENDSTQLAIGFLDELLFVLDKEELGREPYAIAMTWWLARMVVDELGQDGSALAEEIKKWFEYQLNHSATMRKHGRAIRQTITTPDI